MQIVLTNVKETLLLKELDPLNSDDSQAISALITEIFPTFQSWVYDGDTDRAYLQFEIVLPERASEIGVVEYDGSIW